MENNYKFGWISEIDPKNINTYQHKIFLTLDIDWAHDEIIEDTMDILNNYGVKATAYLTHLSEYIEKEVTNNPLIEVGIHPNFNELLKGKGDQKNFKSVITDLLIDFPTAKSSRSHSLNFGSLIATALKGTSITHESSIIVPWQFNSDPLFPWRMYDGLIRVPYFYCDYVSAMLSEEVQRTPGAIANLINRSGLKVFDFHPIHIFLNTENLDRYESTRDIHYDPIALKKRRFLGSGARDQFIELLACSKK